MTEAADVTGVREVPTRAKRERARDLLDAGEPEEALRLLAGGCHAAGCDAAYFELLGRALLGVGQVENAGRFLFLCGVRRPEYSDAIARFLARNHDPRNFRQLHSRLPQRLRTMWRLDRFPPTVAAELRALGFPDDIQAYFVRRREARR